MVPVLTRVVDADVVVDGGLYTYDSEPLCFSEGSLDNEKSQRWNWHLPWHCFVLLRKRIVLFERHVFSVNNAGKY